MTADELRDSIHRYRRMILQAMEHIDDHVVTFDYRDQDNVKTRRVVSPIRFVSKTDFLALCLTREEPRRFSIPRCSDMKLDAAREYVMPHDRSTCDDRKH